jgi:uncharacterized surface protein with fasciclin (FAS1) repeats
MLMNDTVAMTNLLLFHVVPGEILFSADLECDGFLEMANGDLSETICAQNDTAFSQVGEGNSDADTYPDIVQVDLEACNGVIHVIDQVMLFENVTQAPILTDAPTVTVTTVPPETNAPTVAETEAPTASPTASETPSPTAAPTPGATSTAPSDNQLQEITDSPTESTTTTAPIASPTDAPVISPTDAPVIPSAPPVEAPVETPTAVDACQTVTEAACTNDDFSTLCAALTVTGLGDVLNVETDTFTVFAPTNDAFAKLGEAAIDYLLQPEQVQLLSEILLFHVIVDSAVKSTDLECAALYEMANAQESRTICREPVIYQKVSAFMTELGQCHVGFGFLQLFSFATVVTLCRVLETQTMPAPKSSLLIWKCAMVRFEKGENCLLYACACLCSGWMKRILTCYAYCLQV